MLKNIFTINFLLLLALNGQSQNQHLTDSLHVQLKTISNDSIRVEMLFRIGYYTHNIDSQWVYYEKALRLAKKINIEKLGNRVYDSLQVRLKRTTVDSNRVKLYYNLAYSTLDYKSLVPTASDTTHLFKALNDGILIAEKNKLLKLQSKGLQDFGDYLSAQGNSFNARSILLYDAALMLAMQEGDKKSMARTFHSLGFAYRLKGDYSRALDYYNKGNIAAVEARDTFQLMVNYHDLGWMRITMKNYNGSFNYLKKASDLAIALKDSFWIGDNALHLGEAYWWAKQFDSSLIYSNTALQIFTSIKDTFHIIYAINQIGWVHESEMQWVEAEKLYRSALKLWNDSLLSLVGLSFSGLGDALYGQGRYKEALPSYIKAQKFLDGVFSTPVWTRNNYEGLAKTYSKLGDFRNAYEAYIKFKNESDSVLIHENSDKLNASQAEHDFEKLKSETNAAQEKKDILYEAELTKQRSQKFIFIGGALLLLLVAIGLISRLRFARRSRLLLEEKNKLIFEEKEIAERMQLRAEQSEKFKQQFLANMSHEIRTPMNAVMGMTDLLIDKNPRNDQFDYLDGIKNSSKTLLHIINDILDNSKIEAGKIELEQIDFSIREVVGQVKQTLHHQADKSGIQIMTNVDTRIPDVVIGDPVRFNQVLMNLTGNAIKFTEKGSVTIDVSPGETGIKVSIIDTGVGIPAEKLQSVFESFTQAHSSDTRRFGGTGLGLTISRQLVELMGGKISIESEVGSGSIFSFEINYPVGSAERMHMQKSSEQIDGSILNGLKILLADDNEYNRIVARDTLKLKSSVEITEAVNGEDAIEKFSQNDFDVVLMDVQMPVMDGYEATNSIRNKFTAPKNQIPVIALTASVIRSDLDKCRQAGMTDYVSKPFKASQLISTIAKATSREIKFLDMKHIDVKRMKEASNRVIDLGYLEEFCEGDKVRIIKYVNIFLESAPLLSGKISNALKENNFEEIANQIHGFKTKWIMMGMDEAKDLAVNIELQCRKETPDHASINSNALTLIAIVEQAAVELKLQNHHV